MNWGKAFALCIALYLAIALPLYLLNSSSVHACEKACSQEGFDIVISAALAGNETKCRCLDSFTRAEKYITVPQG